MGRKKKNIVDWFPVPVNDGGKMYIMEQQYGDRGYCCYYKLLQLIGRTDNHIVDFSDNKSLLFFSSILRATPEATIQMINTLSEIGAIDDLLWKTDKKIWCQSFVDSVEIVYRNRRVNSPQKPLLSTQKQSDSTQNPDNINVEKEKLGEVVEKISTQKQSVSTHSTQNNGFSTQNNGFSTDQSTQSRVEESRVDLYIFSPDSEIFRAVAGSEILRANVRSTYRFSDEQFFERLETWRSETEARGTPVLNEASAKGMFIGWLKYNPTSTIKIRKMIR